MNLSATPPFLSGAFELAYVTSDLGQALAYFRDKMDMGSFLQIDNGEIAPVDAEAPIVMHVALGYAGDTLIEIIEPVSDPVGIFRDRLTDDGFSLGFHHVGVRVEGTDKAWHALRRKLDEQAHLIALEAKFGSNGKVIFTDQAKILGHYVEYIYIDAEIAALFENVPRNERIGEVS